MEAYITSTGSFLPNAPIDNQHIAQHLGMVPHEDSIKEQILAANGIKTRHYALDHQQNPTHSIYELAAEALRACAMDKLVVSNPMPDKLDFLSSGATHTPFLAPGIASLLHSELSKQGLIDHALEISSHSGICSSGAQAFVSAFRAVKSGASRVAACVGAEQPSIKFRSKVFEPPQDWPLETSRLEQGHFDAPPNIQSSRWFMSTFLRFMLSDGAGACIIEPQPNPLRRSLKIDWTFSRSFANQAPLCMQMPDTEPLMLQQNVSILSRYMGTLSAKVLADALEHQQEQLNNYSIILPHMSSYYFEPSVSKTIKKLCKQGEPVPYWTNLSSRGNTGAASMYIMLDEYVRTQPVNVGDRILLFVPESGQFNYVLISLTVAT